MTTADLIESRVLQTADFWTEMLPLTPDDVAVRHASPLMRALWAPGVKAMTLGQTVFIDPKFRTEAEPAEVSRLMIHELAHARQWRALGVSRFLTSYLTGYLMGRLRGLSHRSAYLAIGLEVEARAVTNRIS